MEIKEEIIGYLNFLVRTYDDVTRTIASAKNRIQAIIQQFRKPMPPKAEPIDWQNKYITLKKDYDDLVKVLEKKEAQIEKLKASFKERGLIAGKSLAAIAEELKKIEESGWIEKH